MEYPPSPTNSEPSRRGSILHASTQGVASHPTVVHTRRPSRFSTDAPPAQPQPNVSRSSLDKANEQSPLLAPVESHKSAVTPIALSLPNGNERGSGISSYDAEDAGNPERETKSSWYLFLLTISLGGLQLAWAVELSNGSPYLLSLGLSKSLLALVWIAGPLSGVLVQPYVGTRSDRCQSRFGRRRPFIVGGAIATVLSLIALAWAREFMGALLPAFGAPRDGEAVRTTTIVFAVVMVYVLDFAVNVIQAAIRAFIVDNAPTHQQDAANAWASRLSQVGNIILYLFGYVDLPRYFWFFGNTQFKDLSVIASIGLLITVFVSCYSIKEKDTRQDKSAAKSKDGLFTFFKTLYRSLRYLPRQISRVCQVQLAAWIGWFPFLFYATTYIGEIYVDPYFRDNPNLTPEEVDAIYDQGTRLGTLALLIFAVTSFAASVIIPWFVVNPFKEKDVQKSTPLTPGAFGPTSTEPLTASNDYFSGPSNGTITPGHGDPPKASGRGFIQRHTARLTTLQLTIPGLTLRRTWLYSHVIFALLMWLTFAARSTTGAIVLVAFVGIPWSITMWAPYALIAAEVRKREQQGASALAAGRPVVGVSDGAGEESHPPLPQKASQTGLILGIHNVAISAPQVLATLISSAIFRALQKPRGVAGDGSVAWVLRFGGACAILAALLTLRVAEAEPLGEDREDDV